MTDTDTIPCDVARCIHPAYIAVRFTHLEGSTRVPGDREWFYCEVHDARTDDGPRHKRRTGWDPKTIASIRHL